MERLTRQPVAWDASAAIYYFEHVDPYYDELARQRRQLRTTGRTVVLSAVAYHEGGADQHQHRDAAISHHCHPFSGRDATGY